MFKDGPCQKTKNKKQNNNIPVESHDMPKKKKKHNIINQFIDLHYKIPNERWHPSAVTINHTTNVLRIDLVRIVIATM